MNLSLHDQYNNITNIDHYLINRYSPIVLHGEDPHVIIIDSESIKYSDLSDGIQFPEEKVCKSM